MVKQAKTIPTTKKHTFDELIDKGFSKNLSSLSPDLLGESIFGSSYARPYAEKIKNKPEQGKNISVDYAAKLLNLWYRACNYRHKVTGNLLADDLFTSQRISLESYYLHLNTSQLITDKLIDYVKENDKALSRTLFTDTNLSDIEKELSENPDLYYYISSRLGWKRFRRSYLHKALAGALSAK